MHYLKILSTAAELKWIVNGAGLAPHFKIPGYYANTYHRLYSIGERFVYQLIIISNTGLIHFVVMYSW